MTDALTQNQVNILRRIRDGRDFGAAPVLYELTVELALLKMLQLIRPKELDFELTQYGHRYLQSLDSSPR